MTERILPSGIKPGWKMPPARPCPTCEAPLSAIIYLTSDGPHLAWDLECESCGTFRANAENINSILDEEQELWPFEGTYAKLSDLLLCGFILKVFRKDGADQ